ncbi:MAG: hypothetical protein HGGPFJEG_00210 [Ignavibacteria bacterium]|nr:hypothetical protein [Ignavibacteria bacterium]
MKNSGFIYLIFTILISSNFISCGDETLSSAAPEGNFTYPFKLTASWYYGTMNFLTNIRPDSIKNYFEPDTIEGYGGIIFLGDTVINNDTLRLMRNNHSDPQHIHSAVELYKQNSSGLYRHAYFSEAYTFTPYRHLGQKLKFRFNNKFYHSPNEIIYQLKNDIDFSLDNSDTVIYMDNPPLLALKYPVKKNDEWQLRDNGSFKIIKKYIDYENISNVEKTYYCIKINKYYYFNNSSTPDTNISYADYFSKEGIVKKDVSIRNIEVYNEHAVLIGYIDTNEEDILNIFSP